tara:strand:- start:2400 stop:2972 length:573 start_codon:yes stop_codon:yes gene_type:complete
MTNDNKTNLKADHGQNIDNKKTNNRKVVTMLNSNKTQSNIDAQFINDAQGFSITGLNLLNINDLPKSLQFLAKARYYLSVINDELIKTGKTQELNREKISNFIAHLRHELEQVTFAFSDYDNNLKALAEPLPLMAEQMLSGFFADDEVVSHIGFIDFLIQTITMSRHLELVCEVALNRQTDCSKEVVSHA